ncbi:MAG: HNH endonuclease [Planctomycetota bacterium]
MSEKHGGATQPENLAYACTICNRAKGTDIGSIAPSTGELSRFFNPRSDRWPDHFQLHGVVIEPRTPVGEATASVLGFNEPERILEREALQHVGRYPPPEARGVLTQSRG